VLEQTATGFRVEVSTLGGLTLDGDSVRPAGTMGVAYNDRLTATGTSGGATAWSVIAGRLPRGLSIGFDGSITGVPGESGSFPFTVSVTSGELFGSRTFQVDVAKPVLQQAAVMSQLLGTGAPLSEDQVRFLDLLGNRNNRLDVGDVRAWMVDQGVLANN